MARDSDLRLLPAARLLPRLPLHALLATLSLWYQRARSRRQLARLDERLLADVGISPSERQAELDKPFWR